jgi:4-amino-4-deoxy-L-arabinose transferase-like glycosyltransferase
VSLHPTAAAPARTITPSCLPGSLPIILAVGLLARLSMLVWYLSEHNWAPETFEYEDIARGILENGEFTYYHLGTPYRSYVGPVFPVISALLHVIGGPSLVAYVLFHLTVALTTVWLTYRLGARWFSEDAGRLAALLTALEPGLLVYNSYKVDVITLSTCLLLCGLLLFDRLAATGRYRWSVLLGGLAGIAILTRLDLIALLAPFAWWLASGRTDRRTVLRSGLLASVVTVAVLTPWLARNYAVHGRVLLTTTSGEQLWIGNYEGSPGTPHPDVTAHYLRVAPPALREAMLRGTELEQLDAFRSEAIRAIWTDPAEFFQRSARKLFYFWWFTPTYGLTYPHIPQGLREGYKALYALLLALAVAGAWAALREGSPARTGAVWTLLAVMLTVALIHSVFFVELRHRVLVTPLILLLSAYGAGSLVASIPRKFRPTSSEAAT